MGMTVFLMKKFIHGFSAIVWDARWFPTIFLISFPVSLNNPKSRYYCGFTGKFNGYHSASMVLSAVAGGIPRQAHYTGHASFWNTCTAERPDPQGRHFAKLNVRHRASSIVSFPFRIIKPHFFTCFHVCNYSFPGFLQLLCRLI